MKYEIVNLKEKLVVGKSIITTNENGKAMNDIGMMWHDFSERLAGGMVYGA